METTRVCSWKEAGDEIHIYIFNKFNSKNLSKKTREKIRNPRNHWQTKD